MRILILSLIILTISLQPASGNDYPNGFLNSDGYTYNNGYWYFGSQPYTRVQYFQPGYYNSYRCWVAGYYFWKYFPYQATLPSYNDPSWRAKLLELASNRDRVEGDIRKGMLEHAYFMQAVNGLGLQGNFRWESYGMYPSFGTGAGAGAFNATTQYGYSSYNSIASLYGDTNLNTLYQQAAQLANGSQKLAGDATGGFQALVGQEGSNRARAAEILAKGQMAQQIITALQASPSVETKGFSFKITQGGNVERIEDNVPQNAKDKLLKDWQVLAQSRCMPCHDSKNKKGNFDITTYPSQPMNIKQQIWQVLTSPDDKVVMPRTPDGGPGKRLTSDEMRLFFLN